MNGLPPKILQLAQSGQVNRPIQEVPFDPRNVQAPYGSQIYVQQNFVPPAQGQRVTYTQPVVGQSGRVVPQTVQNFAQYTSSQYNPGQQVGQTVTYTQPQGQVFTPGQVPIYQQGQVPVYQPPVYQQGQPGKSGMELTLEKIDEQLQMSRKMFPSWSDKHL